MKLHWFQKQILGEMGNAGIVFCVPVTLAIGAMGGFFCYMGIGTLLSLVGLLPEKASGAAPSWVVYAFGLIVFLGGGLFFLSAAVVLAFASYPLAFRILTGKDPEREQAKEERGLPMPEEQKILGAKTAPGSILAVRIVPTPFGISTGAPVIVFLIILGMLVVVVSNSGIATSIAGGKAFGVLWGVVLGFFALAIGLFLVRNVVDISWKRRAVFEVSRWPARPGETIEMLLQLPGDFEAEWAEILLEGRRTVTSDSVVELEEEDEADDGLVVEESFVNPREDDLTRTIHRQAVARVNRVAGRPGAPLVVRTTLTIPPGAPPSCRKALEQVEWNLVARLDGMSVRTSRVPVSLRPVSLTVRCPFQVAVPLPKAVDEGQAAREGGVSSEAVNVTEARARPTTSTVEEEPVPAPVSASTPQTSSPPPFTLQRFARYLVYSLLWTIAFWLSGGLMFSLLVGCLIGITENGVVTGLNAAGVIFLASGTVWFWAACVTQASVFFGHTPSRSLFAGALAGIGSFFLLATFIALLGGHPLSGVTEWNGTKLLLLGTATIFGGMLSMGTTSDRRRERLQRRLDAKSRRRRVE